MTIKPQSRASRDPGHGVGVDALTGVGDVEASAGGGVIRLELQTDDVPAAGQLGRHLVAWERAQHSYVWNPVIFDCEEVKLRLHVKVIKDEVNSAARLRDDQPDAVHVVTVLFWVIRWEDNSWWCRKVEETGNCEDTQIIIVSNSFVHIWRSGYVLRTWEGSLYQQLTRMVQLFLFHFFFLILRVSTEFVTIQLLFLCYLASTYMGISVLWAGIVVGCEQIKFNIQNNHSLYIIKCTLDSKITLSSFWNLWQILRFLVITFCLQKSKY